MLEFEEREETRLFSVASTLYDFTLLYDIVTLISLPQYRKYRFSQRFWFRQGRPLKTEHQLYISRLRNESPLLLEVLFPAVVLISGVAWYLVQSIERIANWPLNRELLKQQVRQARLTADAAEIDLERKLQERDAVELHRRVVTRIVENGLPVVNADFTTELRENE